MSRSASSFRSAQQVPAGRQALNAILAFSRTTLEGLKSNASPQAALRQAFTAYETSCMTQRAQALAACPSTAGTDPTQIVRDARRFVVDEMPWLV